MTPHPEAFHTIPLRLGEGIWQALQERCRRTGESLDHVIRSALAEALDLELHTEDHVQLVLPGTPAFLTADLSGDPSASLAKAVADQR